MREEFFPLAFMPRKPLDILEAGYTPGSGWGRGFIPNHCPTASAGLGAEPQGVGRRWEHGSWETSSEDNAQPEGPLGHQARGRALGVRCRPFI